MASRDKAAGKQQPLNPQRRKFLKQFGYVGAGVAFTDIILQNAHNSVDAAPLDSSPTKPVQLRADRDRCAVYAADGRFELFKSSKKFDADEGRLQHGFPPQSAMPT